MKSALSNIQLSCWSHFRKSFYEDCLQEFECTVCCSHMHPPIRQCVLGHNYCDRCNERMWCCPQCRSPHRLGLNLLLEEFHKHIPFPCKFKDRGCQSLIFGNEILVHERDCFVNWKQCLFREIDSCTWSGPKKEALEHYRNIHQERVYTGPIVTVTWKEFGDSISTMSFIICAYNEMFSCVFAFDKCSNIVHWTVLLVGDPEQAGEYNFEIELADQDDNCESERMVAPCGCTGDGVEIRSGVGKFRRNILKYCKENSLKCKVRINN